MLLALPDPCCDAPMTDNGSETLTLRQTFIGAGRGDDYQAAGPCVLFVTCRGTIKESDVAPH